MNYLTRYHGKRVLVTGGCGFIGSHLVEALVKAGAKVTVIDNLSTGTLDNLSSVISNVHMVVGDILDFQRCLQVVRNQDIVFHLAAFISVPLSLQDPLQCHRVNVDGTIHLLEACRLNDVRAFVFSSSAAVYGAHDGACYEELTPAPTSPYGVSKYMGEQWCMQYASLYGLKTGILRYFNVWGDRQVEAASNVSAIACFRYRMARNLPIIVFGDGHQTRDFVSVHTVIDANMRFGDHMMDNIMPLICNVGTGSPMRLIDVIEQLKAEYPEYSAGVEFMQDRAGDVRHSYASCERFNQWCS